MADELRRRSPRRRLTREEQKALTRSRILESAHTLFAIKGYEGASIDEIASDAGYSRGAFYSNFANKAAVMAELIATGFEGDLAAMSQMAQMVQTPAHGGLDRLREGYREMARRYSADPENTLWSLEFQLAAVRHPELRDGYARQFGKLRQGVELMLVQTYRSLGHPDPESTARFADVFIVVLSGLSLTKLLFPDSFNDKLFEESFAALVQGIAQTQA